MKITVKYIPTHWVAGVEDGDFWYCQHPETTSDTSTNYYTNFNGEVDEYSTPIEVCVACDAFHYALDDDSIEWHDEPAIVIKRLGE